jgi:hypothetical protein
MAKEKAALRWGKQQTRQLFKTQLSSNQIIKDIYDQMAFNTLINYLWLSKLFLQVI